MIVGRIMSLIKHALMLAGVLVTFASISVAITENMDEITMRDAGATKDRPRIDAFDMDEETQQ